MYKLLLLGFLLMGCSGTSLDNKTNDIALICYKGFYQDTVSILTDDSLFYTGVLNTSASSGIALDRIVSNYHCEKIKIKIIVNQRVLLDSIFVINDTKSFFFNKRDTDIETIRKNSFFIFD